MTNHRVISPKNITIVVWYSLVLLSSLNNTMFMVSGVSEQMTEGRKQFAFCLLSSVFGSAEPFGGELRVERLVAGCALSSVSS